MSVFGLSELHFMQLLWRGSPQRCRVRGTVHICCTKVVQSLTWRDVFGRQMSGQIGISRVKAGSFPICGLLRLASRTFPRCLCWAMGRQIIGSLQSCKDPPSPSDSQPARVMDSCWRIALSSAYSYFGTGLLYHGFWCICPGL